MGGLLIEVEFDVLFPQRQRWLHITRVPKTDEELRPFDVDGVYSSIMMLDEVLWTRFLAPWISGILCVLRWRNPWRSVMWLATWTLLYYHNDYLPVALCLAFAIWHWRRKSRRHMPVPLSGSHRAAVSKAQAS